MCRECVKGWSRIEELDQLCSSGILHSKEGSWPRRIFGCKLEILDKSIRMGCHRDCSEIRPSKEIPEPPLFPWETQGKRWKHQESDVQPGPEPWKLGWSC